jgi:hypothetical protein
MGMKHLFDLASRRQDGEVVLCAILLTKAVFVDKVTTNGTFRRPLLQCTLRICSAALTPFHFASVQGRWSGDLRNLFREMRL